MPEAQRCADPAQTQALGRGLAQGLKAGDVVLLSGPLGAGKTCFAKGLAEGLGLDADKVLSPTFQVIRELQGGRLPLYHVDLYRLEGPAEAGRLGLEEYFDGPGISVVEWPERLGSLAPSGAWKVALEPQEDGVRMVSVQQP